jgi:hypothetical protein
MRSKMEQLDVVMTDPPYPDDDFVLNYSRSTSPAEAMLIDSTGNLHLGHHLEQPVAEDHDHHHEVCRKLVEENKSPQSPTPEIRFHSSGCTCQIC